MDNGNMRALYIVVNAGFAEQVVDFIRSQGSSGATIINARGISSLQKEIMGISIDREKEVVLTLTDSEIADKIMEAIKLNAAFKSEAQGICFTLPVSKAIGLRNSSSLDKI
ncbi:P-II family nitrogen regulator [Acetivibrio mesophilus]|uniref:P-II family nitrogen regulator n=1 Tax=Acetivibrio mesophilus TaxID=2487273 RepID=A0A4Q0I4A4_9FIRM|nr:P-II family nitrogen regulator [Acetivibrio mesophilus]ODM26138.1 transcriptional regulator [Clostridium sp. Bc-iso-3]RXE59106.1 P-II family nitrogen regulator [Acetivibrio mesophilus]HHV29514.1 P-II family nitrogen regulator [Clostridium sp.]